MKDEEERYFARFAHAVALGEYADRTFENECARLRLPVAVAILSPLETIAHEKDLREKGTLQ